MKIVYIGQASGTSGHRAVALERLGHEVTTLPPDQLAGPLARTPWGGKIGCRAGYRFLQPSIRRALRQRAAHGKIADVAWVNSAEWLGPGAVRLLKDLAGEVLSYTNDDPISNRDKGRWGSFRQAMAEYDLCAVVREPNVTEFRALGARRVRRVFMSYDEVEHRPLEPDEFLEGRFRADVVFVGTWMPERGPFLAELIQRKVSLAIWGDHWQKAPEWPALEAAWRGPAVYGRDYIKAIVGAKVCLGLLSQGNRDLHTQRSAEAPYAGALFCAERTSEHLEMYREGGEAVFWSNAEECAEVCHGLLNDPHRREDIRRAGMRRVRELEIGNEDIARKILSAL